MPESIPIVGDRVELIHMVDDPDPITPGQQGVVAHVDDAGTVHVHWDNGRRLGLLTGSDQFRIVQPAAD